MPEATIDACETAGARLAPPPTDTLDECELPALTETTPSTKSEMAIFFMFFE